MGGLSVQRVDESLVVASEALARIVEQELRKIRRTPRTVASSADARRYLSAAVPTSVIIGLELADGKCWPLVRWLKRSRLRLLPLIVISDDAKSLSTFERHGEGLYAADQYVWGISGVDGVEIISALMDAESRMPRRIRGASEP